MIPDDVKPAVEKIMLDAEPQAITLEAANTDDRPIQVGPHCLVFETGAPGSGDR